MQQAAASRSHEAGRQIWIDFSWKKSGVYDTVYEYK
jgi:hypothetical protein